MFGANAKSIGIRVSAARNEARGLRVGGGAKGVVAVVVVMVAVVVVMVIMDEGRVWLACFLSTPIEKQPVR